MVVLLYLGLSCILSLEPSLASLESLFESRGEWNAIYGPGSLLESTRLLTSAFFYIICTVCIAISILLLVIVIKGLTIGGT